jgi:ABC-2 type transport system ATP-binding protein
VREPKREGLLYPLIHSIDLSRSFGETAGVVGVSFTVDRAEMFGIIGPDGAGKTTILRLVLGLLAPHGGSVTTCGLDPAGQRVALSDRIGYLSQRFSLYGDLSADENMAFFAEVHAVRGWKPRRDELLGMLRLAEFRRRPADQLSGGMRQKLALACTLIHTPELLVLDEPTTGVDPVSRREFWRILGRLQRDGLTILVTTPYIDEAERCGRVALMDQGRFLEVAAPEVLRGRGHHRMVEVIARPRRAALEWLRGRPEVAEAETFGERLHLSLRGAAVESAGEKTRDPMGEFPGVAEHLAVGLRAAGVEVDSVREILPSLEDIFIARLRREAGAPQRVPS